MNQNKYDDPVFFDKYSKMRRSVHGLAGAGEWETLKNILPNLKDKRILDLGCGFGWHCQYAIEQGAKSVTGVDSSEKMLSEAKKRTSKQINYVHESIENTRFTDDSFDIVLSSLTLHYLVSFEDIVKKVFGWLSKNGVFVFTVEHPIFTSEGSEDWYRDSKGNILHFPVDRYFDESGRETTFLDEKVKKFHKTLTTYLDTLLQNGFEITRVVEPKPSEKLINEMKEELRRPMMLIVSSRKK